MITISTHGDVVCITTTHITVTVTVRVVLYMDGMAITENRKIRLMAIDSILVSVGNWVLGLVVNGE